MKTKRRKACLMWVFFVALAMGAWSYPGEAAESIKIGVCMPITGAGAVIARDSINGLMIAVDDVNKAGGILGGRKIEVIKEDDGSQPSQGVSAIRKLITQDKVVAILGNLNSSVCAATRNVTHELGIPQLALGCSADSLVEDYPYFFRVNTNNTFQTVPFIRWLVRDKNRKRIAILYENTDWGLNLNDVSAKYARKYGAQVLIQEGYNPGTTDYLPVLSKIKKANPDLILSAALINEAAIIIRQAKELGIASSLFAGWGGWTQPDLHKLADGAEEGVIVADIFPAEDPQTPIAKYVVQEVRKRYPDTPPNVFHAQSYDSALVLINAIKASGSTDPKKIRDSIAVTERLPGALGAIKMSPDGQNLGITIYPTQWKKGKMLPQGEAIVAGEE